MVKYSFEFKVKIVQEYLIEETFEGLFNRMRAFNVKTIVVMQVIVDVTKASKELSKQILGNLTIF